jgi:hypothetical protein
LAAVDLQAAQPRVGAASGKDCQVDHDQRHSVEFHCDGTPKGIAEGSQRVLADGVIFEAYPFSRADLSVLVYGVSGRRWSEAGMSYGETNDFSYNIVKDPVHVHDLHATILRILGIDHTKLTYKYQGRHFRLTDVHGSVVRAILA